MIFLGRTVGSDLSVIFHRALDTKRTIINGTVEKIV